MERRPLVLQKKAKWGGGVGSQKSTRMSVPEPGRFGALGSWVPSVGGDGNEPGWWQPSDLQLVCLAAAAAKSLHLCPTLCDPIV